MSVNEFVSAPWRKTHQVFEEAAFNIRPAPEFATAEVLLASTYRSSGFAGLPESDVPRTGRALDKASTRVSARRQSAGVSNETWHLILHGALQSPKQPKQSARRFLQLCPMVAPVTLYSGSARLSGNSWDPGQLVQRMIELGSPSRARAEALWQQLHLALSVDDGDDVWARWLDAEFTARCVPGVPAWEPTRLSSGPTLPESERPALRAPAEQFVQDLAATIRSKDFMTRRQWVSLMESVLRLGAVAHTLWLCDFNDRLWRAARKVLSGEPPPAVADLTSMLAMRREQSLVYGRPALPIIRDLASRYLSARLGFNLLLWRLDELRIAVPALNSVQASAEFLGVLAQARSQLGPDMLDRFRALEDQEARTLACRKGIGSNLVEFCRYALGQRQTADSNLRGYDQGYILHKKADYASAPWVVALGPVALLAMVHCCLDEVSGPRSVQRLCEHLSWYGLNVDMDNIAKSDLGKELRLLGLVLDSPDAESGMLLIPPFAAAQRPSELRR